MINRPLHQLLEWMMFRVGVSWVLRLMSIDLEDEIEGERKWRFR